MTISRIYLRIRTVTNSDYEIPRHTRVNYVWEFLAKSDGVKTSFSLKCFLKK